MTYKFSSFLSSKKKYLRLPNMLDEMLYWPFQAFINNARTLEKGILSLHMKERYLTFMYFGRISEDCRGENDFSVRYVI